MAPMLSPPSNILVVDDNPTNLQVLFEMLQTTNYRVAIAKSGKIALERIKRNLPDLILLDVVMPGMDGFELCQRLKSAPRTRDIPIIFMTALSNEGDRVKGLEMGAVDYITKPIQQKEAMARIQLHLNLKQTQVHLVQSEKLSSLGQMMAGIAHEINNPITFIYGNIEPATAYVQDLLQLISILLKDNPTLSPEAQDHIEAVDLDFIRADLPKLLTSMEVGTERIRDIVLSLRNFARLDEAARKKVDIQTGIDSTLLILQHRIKASAKTPGIEIVRNYEQLPKVECYPSQLNQVFMNLLGNAIDALEQQHRTRMTQNLEVHPSRIEITTKCTDSSVTVEISDNGPGIPEDLYAKIFEPFFTTKDVGKGTGLGLSISHQIVVDKHGGKMSCQSEPGKGTQFVVEIPISQDRESLGPDDPKEARPSGETMDGQEGLNPPSYRIVNLPTSHGLEAASA